MVPEPVEGTTNQRFDKLSDRKFLAQSSKFKNISYLCYVKFTSY